MMIDDFGLEQHYEQDDPLSLSPENYRKVLVKTAVALQAAISLIESSPMKKMDPYHGTRMADYKRALENARKMIEAMRPADPGADETDIGYLSSG